MLVYRKVIAKIRSSPQSKRIEITCIAAAALIAHAYYIAWLDVPILHDAAGYLRVAKQILKDGLFNQYEMSDLRTYLYPWCLGQMIRLSELLGAPLRLVVFECQLILHVLASLLLRRALLITGLPACARLTFGVVVLNPLVLIYTGYLLTESVSLSLEILLFACAASLVSAVSLRAMMSRAAALTLMSGLMIMIRPANMYLLPAVALALGLVLWKYRPRPLPTVCVLTASAMSFSLPFLPQLTNNITYYGKTTPLLVYNLGDVQQRLGVQYIKYATVHIREHDAAVFYHNPYQNTQSLAAPLAWCLENPGKAALTVALHVFNLLDQDLPFPYSTNLLPWYYPLASLLNLLVVALGFVGVILAPFLIRPYGISAVSLYVIAVAALIGHFGLHSMVMAEARFGVPALLILYAFAAWVVAGVLPVLKPRACGAALAVAGIAALAGSQLSEWVRWQAPEIRMALERRNPRLQETARTVASSAVTGKRFDSPNLPDWTLSEGGVGSHGEAILISNAPGQVSLIQHPVKLDKGTDYIVEFDARAALPPDAYLRADLQAPAYDGPEQESTFMFYGDYRHFSVRWNSGPEAPSDAKLRFRTLSTAPIQIRNITFRKAPL